MLTPNQEQYLSKIPDDLKMTVLPWDPSGLDIAQGIIDEIKLLLPDNKVIFIGSLPLKIAGQKDIDLSVLSDAKDFPLHQPKLEEKFGKPDKLGVTSIGWHFERQGWDVGIYLTDPVTSKVQEQIEAFNLLKNNANLLKEYEQIKLAASNLSYKQYQIKKYEFYNRILGYEEEKYLTLVKEFVKESFIKAHKPGDIKHFERTIHWLLQLRPDADEALRIAAFAHDTERAFRDEAVNERFKASNKGFTDEDHLMHHQNKGAKIIADFLKEQNAPQELIDRVQMLISKHEVGGNDDQNLLKDADSVSYFENQIEHFLTSKVAEVGREKVREKFQWMFDRITAEKAKELAKPMFEDSIKKLES